MSKIKTTTKEPPLLYIEWEDACSEHGWKDQDEVKEWVEDQGLFVKQVGWLIGETKTHYNFAARKSDTENTWMQFGNLQKIPKTWIRRKINLSKHVCLKKNLKKSK